MPSETSPAPATGQVMPTNDRSHCYLRCSSSSIFTIFNSWRSVGLLYVPFGCKFSGSYRFSFRCCF